jgi:hypothetical protein
MTNKIIIAFDSIHSALFMMMQIAWQIWIARKKGNWNAQASRNFIGNLNQKQIFHHMEISMLNCLMSYIYFLLFIGLRILFLIEQL